MRGWESVLLFGVQKFTLNQYLGSVNYKMDKNSIFGVHKSEERKNRGICLALTSHGVQCDPEVANHEINVPVSSEIRKKHYRGPRNR